MVSEIENLLQVDSNPALSIFNGGFLTAENYKDKVTEAEEYLLKLPQVKPKVTQLFLPGLYSRSITIPTGMVLTGGVHKTDSLIFVSSGKIIVATDNGNVTIESPASFIGKKGTKRIAYCLEECVWTNVHAYYGVPLDEDTMKDFIVCDTYADYEIFLIQEDYRAFLAEQGWSDIDVVKMTIQTDDVVAFKEETYITIKPSKISCNGVFTTKEFKKDEYVGKGSLGLNRTLLTRFTNHSNKPNIKVSMDGDDLIFKALIDLKLDSELLVDYRDIIAIRRQI